MLGEILYSSFLAEKGRTDYFRLGKARKSFLDHVKLWNIIAPCLTRDSTLLLYSLRQLNEYSADEITAEELKCFSDNPTASKVLFFLVNQIDIELCGGRNNSRLNMLIRACHNIPRCMITGSMYCNEEMCIKYSLSDMDEDIKSAVSAFLQ